MAEVTGVIESCSGWKLNSLPELKSFLKDGEAESYRGVEVKYIHGKKAVLTVYEDGEEQEKITLSEYNTKEEMHQLMAEKGFEKSSEEEIKELMRKLEEERKRDIQLGAEKRKEKQEKRAIKRAIRKAETEKKAEEEKKETETEL